MLIAGGLLAVGVLAIIGVVLLSIERKAAPEPQAAVPSRATIPLQQLEEPEQVDIASVPVPVTGSEASGDESLTAFSEEKTRPMSGENKQLYEIVNQLQQLQHRVETLEHHLNRQNIVSSSFNHYEDQDESVLRTVPVAVHNDSHQ